MEAKIAVLAGITIGGLASGLTGSLYMAILTALCTGTSSYIGYCIAKYVHKNYIIKIITIIKIRKK